MWEPKGSSRSYLTSIAVRVAVLASLISVSQACFALGGCGFGGCIPYCYMRYCARAKDAKTFNVDESSNTNNRIHPGMGLAEHLRPIVQASKPSELAASTTQVTFSKADETFLECCRRKNLPETCLQTCNYASYSAESLHAMFFRINACPIEHASEIHFCASGGFDHQQCCDANGVGSTMAGPKCFVFCAEEPKNSTQLDFSYVPCLSKLEEMKRCFQRSADSPSADTSLAALTTSTPEPWIAIIDHKNPENSIV